MGYDLNDCLVTFGEWKEFRQQEDIHERYIHPHGFIESLLLALEMANVQIAERNYGAATDAIRKVLPST